MCVIPLYVVCMGAHIQRQESKTCGCYKDLCCNNTSSHSKSCLTLIITGDDGSPNKKIIQVVNVRVCM